MLEEWIQEKIAFPKSHTRTSPHTDTLQKINTYIYLFPKNSFYYILYNE